jgi:hypothetical protein
MQERYRQPVARDQGLVIQELGDESLVYDRETDVAHCLGAVATRVWRACNGERDLGDLARFSATSEDLAAEAVDELRSKGLLVAPPASAGDSTDVSRRHALKRIVGTGLAATSMPLIVSATVASAAGSTSPTTPLCMPCPASGCPATYMCQGGWCIPSVCVLATTCPCPVSMPVCMDIPCQPFHMCCP